MASASILGTGLMGQPLAQRLAVAGLTVTAYNRTAAKLEALQAAGIAIAPSPAAALTASDCTILMLTDAAAIHATLLSEAAKPALAGRTIIQMGTIAPSQSRQLCQDVAAAGGEYLEAPVLGSIPQAQQGTLLLMVGATPDQFQRWRGLLKHFGPEPLHLGPVGTGSAVKLAMNQLIGALTTAFALSLSFVQQSGADVEDFMAITRQSALYAPTFDKKLARMCDRQFDNPNFPAKHLLKDLRLFTQEAAALGLETGSVAALEQVLERTLALGLAEADYSALVQAIAPPTAENQ
ncbi:MAG: NAD(P)-dependent oxidoreductase [Spirulinaceae cyanobacterium SM2_1_0]|nr:NAD(P)-dependent oxidoreductase [Spirulinaceae cyanobacterium SM2_1_0]